TVPPVCARARRWRDDAGPGAPAQGRKCQMDEPVHHSESPFLDFLGTRVEDWSDGYARISLDLEPHHLNRAGVIHGGVLATLLDHGAGFCGLYCTVPGNRRYG